MEGTSAEGTRETNTIEAGVIGNDRPLTIVSERWYSQELQTEMMTRHSDPRTGEQTTHLTNVRLGEPDPPSLFQHSGRGIRRAEICRSCSTAKIEKRGLAAAQ